MASLDYELDNRKNHLELKTDTEYCIGRDPDCPVCLGEIPRISRRHCVIYFNTAFDSFALADLYSTNGTSLNGRKIGHLDVPLHDGDRIAVGPVDFVFHEARSAPPRSVSTGTTRIPMISRAAPFPIGRQTAESKQFRFRKGDLLPFNERVVEQLPSSDWSELYLTLSPENERHFFKIPRDLPRHLSAGRELRKTAAKIPSLTGLLPLTGCGSLDDGSCFFITAYLEAVSYVRMISMLSPLDQIRSLALIYSAAMILSRGRQNNLFHGCLKPASILYTPKAEIYITGMGLSEWRERFFPDWLKRPGQWYAAPETTAGKSVWQSDQYALGIMLFQLLTGVLPFRADTPEELAAMHREKTMPLPPERNPQVQTIPAVDAVMIRMTMKDPADRYGSWEELLADLERANSLLKTTPKNAV